MDLWLSDYLESFLISVDGNEVLASRRMRLPTLSSMWWEQDYPSMGVRKMQVCHYSTLNFSIQNCIIVGYSQEYSVLESISSLGKNGQNHWCAHTIPCNKTSKSREAISAGKLEFLRLYIRYNHEIKTLMHFGTLAFGYIETLLISVDGNEVLASRIMSLPTFSTMWWEQR